VTADSSTASILRGRVSTGYGRLDGALQGGFLAGSVIILCAPASDEVPTLLKQFLEVEQAGSLLVCRTLSSADAITHDLAGDVKSLICSDKPVPPSKNVIPSKGIDNLTDVNLQLTETLVSVKPKRIALDILSDALLRHKGLQTRKWLTELLERLRGKGITTLALLNPHMHSSEDVQAVVDLFDGNLEIIEKDVEGSLRKFLRVKWMHGIEIAEKEFPLIDLTVKPQTPTQPMATAVPLKEPRYLTPLISRTKELDRLKVAFEEAVKGRGLVIALQGEAGVGKSRLMQELASYANSKGALTLSGRASRDGVPYGVWVEVARQYVAQSPGELLRRMLGNNASELVKLVPDLAVKLGTIPPPRLKGPQDKIQFYEAVTQFFIAINKPAPLLLLFEDAQYLDQPSAELWEYFVRSSSILPILTVCSTPPEDQIEANSQLEHVLLKFNKERLLETIPLKGLGKDDTTELIKQSFGEQTITPEFADLIYQHTGGNPFFVEEVLRSLVTDGTLYRTEMGWDRKPIQDITVPKTVKTALRGRLGKLDPETIAMLQWAAMIGSEFDFDILKEASQLSEDSLLQKLETANNQGLIMEIPNGQGKLRFVDERIRDLILDEVMQLKRRRYHLKIAEAMEKTYAQSLGTQARTIANHFAESGDKEKTTKYSIMAGDWDLSTHAYEQAANNYKRAIDLTDLKESKQRSALLEKQAEAYDRAGKLPNSLEAYHEALNLTERLGDHPSCARISAKLSLEVYRVKGPEEALRFSLDAVKYVKDTPESFEAASLYGMLATYVSHLERYEECNNWGERALEAGERTGNYAAVSTALGYMGGSLLDTGRIDEGLPLLERSLEVAQKNNLYTQASDGFVNLACYCYPRDLAGARDTASRWLAFTRQQNLPFTQAGALVLLAFFDTLRGEWQAALKGFQDAFELKNRVGFKFRAVNAEAKRAELFLGLGELEKAEESCQLALERHDEHVCHVVATDLALGKLRVEEGRVEEANAHFEAGVRAFKNYEFTTMPLWHVEVLLHLSKIHVQQGCFEDARGLVDWARRLGETLKSDAGLAMALQAEAGLLAATGDGKGAEATYLECLTLWEKAGWPYYRAKALVAYSEALAQTHPDESRRRLRQAAEIFRKLGAKRDLGKTEAKLSRS
jgi:predicted ATPase